MFATGRSKKGKVGVKEVKEWKEKGGRRRGATSKRRRGMCLGEALQHASIRPGDQKQNEQLGRESDADADEGANGTGARGEREMWRGGERVCAFRYYVWIG